MIKTNNTLFRAILVLMLALGNLFAQTGPRQANIIAVNPVVTAISFSFDVVLLPTTVWGNNVYDKALGDCSWFFQYNDSALTNPEIVYTAPEVDTAFGYTNSIAIIANRLGLTTDVSLGTFSGTELLQGQRYHLFTIRMDIIDPSRNSGIMWDTLNTGLLTVIDNIVQTTASSDTDVPLSLTAIGDNLAEVPEKFRLFQNYPNPFNPETTIRFEMPIASRVKVTVFDILGRHIRQISNDQLQAGSHLFKWDGRNDSGESVGSGLYLLVTETETAKTTLKMTLLK
ncbi:MAG: FlgD immunoglobulin-like domain containing protein [Calditrichia bacterium]